MNRSDNTRDGVEGLVERFTVFARFYMGRVEIVERPDPQGHIVHYSDYAALEAENARLRERIAVMDAALEPFSDMAGEMFARGWDASNVALALDNPDDPHRVTAGDFFAARAARTNGGSNGE